MIGGALEWIICVDKVYEKNISEGSETFQVYACFKANSSGKGAREWFSLSYYVGGFDIASIIILILSTTNLDSKCNDAWLSAIPIKCHEL